MALVFPVSHQKPATMKAVSAIPMWKDSKMWLLEEEGEDATFEFIDRIKSVQAMAAITPRDRLTSGFEADG